MIFSISNRLKALTVFSLVLIIFSYVSALEKTRKKYSPRTSADKTSTRLSGSWHRMETTYFTVYYRPGANLKKIERRLRKRSFYITGIKKPGWNSSVLDKIAYRLDRLFLRAKEILDMNPRMKKVIILIFKSRSDVKRECQNITKTKRRVKSFYYHKQHTIYISEQDISDSILAHEIGHALVDHYFLIPPPLKLKEMLAYYVDMHLEEERIMIE